MPAVRQVVKTDYLAQVGAARVAVRDKFAEEAIRHNVPLVLIFESRPMTLQPKDIIPRRLGISSRAFPDILGGRPNYLWYYKHVPDQQFVQKKLFSGIV